MEFEEPRAACEVELLAHAQTLQHDVRCGSLSTEAFRRESGVAPEAADFAMARRAKILTLALQKRNGAVVRPFFRDGE
jgi:hypothetical protein